MPNTIFVGKTLSMFNNFLTLKNLLQAWDLCFSPSIFSLYKTQNTNFSKITYTYEKKKEKKKM